ncbi:MAG: UDP-N-acetylmuramoylalanine--D-glutamate ligase [Bacteroidetes bacterium RIFCSPHIGHO2_02_FULL_44_7]|nr:MAG: UDP-N-acetylmuramoylalanine--D-glutamate ligase [Bacteroidetes bacterium RIFCSPHIGHO2_02_FULL_44_7]
MVIKTAGMPKRLVNQTYATATNIFFANSRGTIIGVTGSKGKSTTASLIYEMLKAGGLDVKLVGNIGIPMLDELRAPESSGRFYVCELSSYQLEDLKYSPHIGVFINFFPDHLDYHGGLEAYFNAKKNIVAYATPKDYFVFNPDYDRLVRLSLETRAQTLTLIDTLPFSENAIPLLGKHNVLNVRAAVTAARLVGVSDEVIEKAVRNFKALPHRLENVGTVRDVTFYDDAISTTPESTIAALEALATSRGKVGTIFLGGTDRGYDFRELARVLVAKGIRHIVFFPESGVRILEALRQTSGGESIEVFQTREMRDAVVFAYQKTVSGSICLLSTASPSYSLWKNFEEKGDLFQRFVKESA